jgi:hypothetical protein
VKNGHAEWVPVEHAPIQNGRPVDRQQVVVDRYLG